MGYVQAFEQLEGLREVSGGYVNRCPSLRRHSITGAITSTCGYWSDRSRCAIAGTVSLAASRAASARVRRTARVHGQVSLTPSCCRLDLRVPGQATAHFVRDGGFGIFLCAIGSACIPLPPGGDAVRGIRRSRPRSSHAHHPLAMSGDVSLVLLGTIAGSWVAYAVGRAGRLEFARTPRVRSYTWAGADSSERTAGFALWPAIVLFGRMVPLIRPFSSRFAGVAKMPLCLHDPT